MDRNKSYQATMLPTAAGGYRWAVFTSTRPYGNILNLPAISQDYSNTANNGYSPMMNTSALQSMLWVAAVDDTASGATDRSHPAFFLPNQTYSETGGYLNERAYWVTEACRAAGSGAASSCDVDEDCCGGTASPKTGVCRIDTPISSPPTRHCASVPPPNACIAAAGACSADTDCCFNYPCVANICTKPPPLPHLQADQLHAHLHRRMRQGHAADLALLRLESGHAPGRLGHRNLRRNLRQPGHVPHVAGRPHGRCGDGRRQGCHRYRRNRHGLGRQRRRRPAQGGQRTAEEILADHRRLIPNLKVTSTPTLTDWRQSYSCPPQE